MKLANLAKRSLVLQGTRDFFIAQGFMEVETPILSRDVIPEAHIDPFSWGDRYLLPSPELYMKQLLAQGAGRIFQICKCFRKDELGPRHLPELTLLEWYVPGQTYEDLMVQCQDLIRHLAARMGMDGRISYQGACLDLIAPFERLTVAQAFERYASLTLSQAMAQGKFDEIISFEVEPFLGRERPCFLCDYPAPLASLARLHPDNPQVAQRFELYAAGIELANGFTELIDPDLQRSRFAEENRIRATLSLPPLPLPEAFLSALAQMPEAAGIALGFDRLVMLLCNAAAIDEVVAFAPGIG